MCGGAEPQLCCFWSLPALALSRGLSSPLLSLLLGVQFSTLWRSFLTCFLLMMNDNGVTYNFIYLQGESLAT